MKPDTSNLKVPHDVRRIALITSVLLLGLVLGVVFFLMMARAF